MAGGHGGRRPGAGRRLGSKDLIRRDGEKRRLVERATAAATEYLRTNEMEIFEGDSIALMISIYRNEKLPLNIRLQCAMAVAPFERPRLNAVAMVRKDLADGASPAFGKLFAQLEARLALQPPEARAALIEVLRSEPEVGNAD